MNHALHLQGAAEVSLHAEIDMADFAIQDDRASALVQMLLLS